MKQYILALDQGTTSSRAILYDHKARVVAISQKEFKQIFPKAGWVEHDPMDILKSQLDVLYEVIKKSKVDFDEIMGIGITNQRETTVVWDKNTGLPVYNAIVWQDTRTSEQCEELKDDEQFEKYIRTATGLRIDSYFSATKLHWILENVKGARKKAENGDLLFGTVDSWLIWNLTNGESHITDFSNASRTMLYNIAELRWDDDIIEKFDIPTQMLPEVTHSGFHFGTAYLNGGDVSILGVAGDQQAALFGQGCLSEGDVKNTYGTGCFMLMNIGEKLQYSNNGLLTTIAWGLNGEIIYALEGSVFMAGAAIQWLRDGLKMIQSAEDTEAIARRAKSDSDVYMVPAFAGLGAPFWDMYARGGIFGLTRDTTQDEIIKATLESLAYQTRDVLFAMSTDSGVKMESLQVDGGASANDYLMQFQADILNVKVERPTNVETTALGVAFIAGITGGLWSLKDVQKRKFVGKVFKPKMDELTRTNLYTGWHNAVKRCMNWAK
jgi:glycerol kinase